MYVLYKSKNILTLVTIGYIVGFIVGMYIEYCLWAQVAVLNHKLLYWTVWDRFMQVLYLGRAPRTKETLPDFREKCRVTRHSRVFRGLTGSQRTSGFGHHKIPFISYPKICSKVQLMCTTLMWQLLMVQNTTKHSP